MSRERGGTSFTAGPPQGEAAPPGGSERSERGGTGLAAGPPQGEAAPSGGSERSERGGTGPAAGPPHGEAAPLLFVLDTNIVLDLWVFNDPQMQPLREVLALPGLGDGAPTLGAAASAANAPRWLATAVMREELARVLAYPHLVRRQALDARVAEQVLAAYDRAVTLCPVAPKARFTCTDGDDQKFIDLAAARACPPPLTAVPAPPSVVLVSKDKAVLRLKKRLGGLGVWVGRHWPTA